MSDSRAAARSNPPTAELTDWDFQAYRRLVSTELSQRELEKLITPPRVYPDQRVILAVHWHPEHIPLEVVMTRYRATFPGRTMDLVIPTQHNEILVLGGYAGVEVDCHARSFSTKVQLLLHFEAERIAEADALKGMIAHTFKYRSSQLHQFIDTIVNPKLAPLFREAAELGAAEDELVDFIRLHTGKLKGLLERNRDSTPPAMIKNKLLSGYFDQLRERHDDHLIDRAQLVLRNVKRLVKRDFSLEYFFEVEEIIEETRSVGGGIVVPHPEQFWPVLLAEYDVDGYEVWNPQSQQYTRFLIDVLIRQNRRRERGRRPLLVFMGDDTHLSTKLKDPRHLRPIKAHREVGVQSAWDEVAIQKCLSVGGFNRRSVIEEYMARLCG
jgi:hypothetical protein